MEYAQRKRTGIREKFPDAVIFEETVKPSYPKSGLCGRHPEGIELMLRMYFLQIWFNWADEALDENMVVIEKVWWPVRRGRN